MSAQGTLNETLILISFCSIEWMFVSERKNGDYQGTCIITSTHGVLERSIVLMSSTSHLYINVEGSVPAYAFNPITCG